MKLLSIVSVALILVIQTAHGQYYEDCRYECEVISCDYYTDYCDYDCYEVCYPYRSQRESASDSASPSTIKLKAFEPVAVKGRQIKSENQRSGKPIRMRLANPSFQTVYRGQVAMTRGSPPRGFALFQGCLNNRKGPSEVSKPEYDPMKLVA